MSTTLPLVGLMLGDCAGIGPEQSAKILSAGTMKDAARLLVVGDRRVLAMGARDAGVKLDIRTVKRPEDADWNSPAVQMIDLANIDPASVKRGIPTRDRFLPEMTGEIGRAHV